MIYTRFHKKRGRHDGSRRICFIGNRLHDIDYKPSNTNVFFLSTYRDRLKYQMEICCRWYHSCRIDGYIVRTITTNIVLTLILIFELNDIYSYLYILLGNGIHDIDYKSSNTTVLFVDSLDTRRRYDVYFIVVIEFS